MKPCALILFLACLLFAVPGTAAEPASISVRGQIFHLGDTADTIFATLSPADAKKSTIAPDPGNPRNRIVTHYYEIEGKSFSLTFARGGDSEPFELIRISTSPDDQQDAAQPDPPAGRTAK